MHGMAKKERKEHKNQNWKREQRAIDRPETLRVFERSQANGLQSTGKPVNAEDPDQQMTSS